MDHASWGVIVPKAPLLENGQPDHSDLNQKIPNLALEPFRHIRTPLSGLLTSWSCGLASEFLTSGSEPFQISVRHAKGATSGTNPIPRKQHSGIDGSMRHADSFVPDHPLHTLPDGVTYLLNPVHDKCCRPTQTTQKCN